MSYENAIMKMKRLEDKGYLNYGDKSTRYSQDTHIYNRFFNRTSDDVLEHLKNRIRQVLNDEKVLYNVGYDMVIVPHERMKEIVDSATSYSQMAKELNELHHVYAREEDGKLLIRIYAEHNGKVGDFTGVLIKHFCEICDEEVTYEYDEKSFHHDYFIMTSKCDNKEEVMKEIDELLGV